MAAPELLLARARRAYELGRLRSAALIVVLIIPVAAVCALASSSPRQVACVSLVLVATAVVLRWRSRGGAEAVTTGLLAALVPLAAGLCIVCGGGAVPDAIAAVVCVVAGGVGGLVLGVRTAQRAAGARAWLFAVVIACLGAALGCVGLGPAAVGVAAGLVIGAGAGALVRRRHA